MNVYFVISEELMTHAARYDPPEPPEYGCIVEIVRAESNSQARYLAWKNSRSFEPDLAEMPNFRTRKIGTDDGPKGVLTAVEASPWWHVLADIEEASGPVRAPEGR